MNRKGGVLILFSKAPIAGCVKQRLIPSLGKDRATQLYVSLVHHTLGIAKHSVFNTVELHCSPITEHDFFRNCEQQYDLVLRQQQGNDLGERMNNALSCALEDYEFAVIAGCDCPGLNTTVLDDVYRQLENGCEVVLGPCEDGGYFLIGATRVDRQLFENMAWSTGTVLEDTRDRLRELGVSWYETDTLWDVDREEDFYRLGLFCHSLVNFRS